MGTVATLLPAPWRVWVGLCLITLALVLPRPSWAASRQWTPPRQLARTAWSAAAPPRLELVEPSAPVALSAAQLLLVPIRAGDRLRLSGAELELGLGSGYGDTPDSIVWWPAHGPEFQVPHWSSARFLVVRSRSARTGVRVEVAAAAAEPLAWHRYDADLTAALEQGAALPEPPDPQLAPFARTLSATRIALGGAPRAPVARYLLALWLHEALRERPLEEPYFGEVALDTQGGRPLLDEQARPEVELRAGERLQLSSERADVIALWLRSPVTEPATVRVWEGGRVAQVLRSASSARALGVRSWTATTELRVVLPALRPRAELEVIEGTVRVRRRAFAQRAELGELFSGRRARRALLANVDGTPTLRALGLALARGDLTPLRPLSTTVHSAAERTLVLAELLRAATGAEQEWLGARYAAALGELPGAVAVPLARSTLEAVAESRVSADIGGASAWIRALRRLAAAPGASLDDSQALRVLSETLAVTPDGGRPLYAALAERHAITTGNARDGALARAAWSREAPWSRLETLPGATTETIFRAPAAPDTPDGRCLVEGAHGLRWSVFDSSPRSVTVAATSGTHARVPLRTAVPEPHLEGTLTVDNIPIHLHPLTGLPSWVGLTPGAHQFRVTQGEPVLARVPRLGTAPCAELRDRERWIVTDAPASFIIPDGPSPTVARVLVSAERLPEAPVRFEVRGGSERYPVWLRAPASGAVEVPVPPAVTRLEVRATAPLRIRAAARLRPMPLFGADPGAPSAAPVRAAEPPRTRAELLQQVRDATRRARSARSWAPRALAWQQRAEALEVLGYTTLAALDRQRLGQSSHELDLDADEPAPLRLPQEAGPVVPLGLPAKIPPLPPPADAAALARARRAHEAGRDPSTVLAHLGAPPGASPPGASPPGASPLSASPPDSTAAGSDWLLRAQLAARLGDTDTAARAFERLGVAHRSGAALGAAASWFADEAARRRDRTLALYAYALARRAVELGDPASAALAKLGSSIHWVRPLQADSPVGSALIEQAPLDVAGPTLSESVRRAWLDAPADAQLLSDERRLEISLRRSAPATLDVGMGCETLALDGRCRLQVLLDDHASACTPWPRREPELQRCRVVVPAGDHRVRVELPQDREAWGWVRVVEAEDDEVLESRSLGSWLRLDPNRPLHLELAGPTVLRVTGRLPADPAAANANGVDANAAARGTAPAPRPLRLQLRAEDRVLVDEPWPLPTTIDPSARRADARTGARAATHHAVALPDQRSYAITTRGRHRFTLESPGGVAFVRVELASARRAPELPPAPNPAPAPAPSPTPTPGHADTAPRPAWAAPVPPAVAEEPAQGPLSWSAYTALVDSAALVDLDQDRARRYGELGGRVHRELLPNRLWLQAGPQLRLRDGPASYGAELDLDLASNGAWPGLWLRTRAMLQPEGGQTHLGGSASIGALWSVRLPAELRLTPSLAQAFVAVDPDARDVPGRDPDVYAAYAAAHPRATTLGLRLDQRPLVDTRGRFGVWLRSMPDLDELDRVDLRFELDTLPGRGFTPWLGLSTLASYRPWTEQREHAFWRFAITPSALFWTWQSPDIRLLLDARATYVVDYPQSARSGSVSALIAATFEYNAGRGLQDHAPRQRPFRDRLEEPYGRSSRAGTRAPWIPDE